MTCASARSTEAAFRFFTLRLEGIMQKVVALSLVFAASCVGFALAPVSAEAKSNRILTQHERFCSTDQPKLDQAKAAKGLNLSDAQKSAFKDYEDTRLKSEADMKTIVCTNKADFTTFPGRLAAHQVFLEAHLAALKTQSPKLITFYNSLDAEQKALFDETGDDRRRGRRNRSR
jgi:hypothetical protein